MKIRNILALGTAVGLTALASGCKKDDGHFRIQGENSSLEVWQHRDGSFSDRFNYTNHLGENVEVLLCGRLPRNYDESPRVCALYIDDIEPYPLVDFKRGDDYFGIGKKAGEKWMESCKATNCLGRLQKKFPDLYEEPVTWSERLD